MSDQCKHHWIAPARESPYCSRCMMDKHVILERELAEARREIERLNALLAGERKINSGMVAYNAMTTNVNARLCAALEWYAEPKHHLFPSEFSSVANIPVFMDNGARAREALKREE
jgi:hypothetical protein